GSWITWVLAVFQAWLSSICRLTHVVRIETSPITVATTTSVQTAARRRRLSDTGRAAVTVAGDAAVVTRRQRSWAPANRRPDGRGKHHPMGMTPAERFTRPG